MKSIILIGYATNLYNFWFQELDRVPGDSKHVLLLYQHAVRKKGRRIEKFITCSLNIGYAVLEMMGVSP